MALNYQTNDPSQGSAFNWGSLISPTIGAVGSYIGGQQSKNGIDAANAQQNQIYNQVAGIYQPQYATGVGADKGLASALGLNGAAPNYAAFENSPGYQFTLQQGDQAINRAAASTGNAYNSSTLAALDKYNSGLAQQTYQNYVGNLLSTAGLGNQAAAGMAAARYNTGANIGQGLQNIGGINQSGVNSAFSQFAGPLGNLAKNYFMSGGGGGGILDAGAAGGSGIVDLGGIGSSDAAATLASGWDPTIASFSSAGGQAAADTGAASTAGLGAAGDIAAPLALFGAQYALFNHTGMNASDSLQNFGYQQLTPAQQAQANNLPAGSQGPMIGNNSLNLYAAPGTPSGGKYGGFLWQLANTGTVQGITGTTPSPTAGGNGNVHLV